MNIKLDRHRNIARWPRPAEVPALLRICAVELERLEGRGLALLAAPVVIGRRLRRLAWQGTSGDACLDPRQVYLELFESKAPPPSALCSCFGCSKARTQLSKELRQSESRWRVNQLHHYSCRLLRNRCLVHRHGLIWSLEPRRPGQVCPAQRVMRNRHTVSWVTPTGPAAVSEAMTDVGRAYASAQTCSATSNSLP